MVIESRYNKKFNKRLITESGQDKRVQNYLKQNGYSDYNQRMELIGSIKHDIPNLRLDNNKFLLGCLRMYIDGELGNEQSVRYVDNALKYIHAGNHIEEYSEDLNGLSPNELHETFRETVKDFSNNDRERSNSREFNGVSEYNIIPIDSYAEARQYGRYTSWCVTHGENAFMSYTSCGERFYFCLKKGFENLIRNDRNAPINEWGLSMIAVNVDTSGNLTRVTTRYNHDYNGENNPQLETTEQLENVLNVPFYQTFKPYTNEELLNKGIVPFDMAQELLNSEGGRKYFSFEEFDDDFDFIYANHKMNLVRKSDNKILSPIWFDNCEGFSYGWLRIELNDMYNYLNEDGKFMFPNQWLKYASDFTEKSNGLARVIFANGEHNFIRLDGTLLCDKGFDNVTLFRNGLSVVDKGSKKNFLTCDGKILYPNLWFDEILKTEFRGTNVENPRQLYILKTHDNGDNLADIDGNILLKENIDMILGVEWSSFLKIKHNGKFNGLDSNLQLISPIWFDSMSRFTYLKKASMVRVDGKYNFVTLQGELVFPNIWFDDIKVCPLMVTYHNKDNQVVQAELDNNGKLYNEKIVDGSQNESKRFSLYGSKIIVTESQFNRLMRNITSL